MTVRRMTVFTNGCFDILHAGHIDLLERAAKLGDRLIVGINSDDSIRRLKGEKRPINNQFSRRCLLLALRCVYDVLVFVEDTPCGLIAEIRPDIHVKGGDYREEDLPEAEIVKSYGGRVVILPLLEGYSTTSIFERIKEGPK